MTDGDRSYWDKHAKNYDRSMSLLGRPIPRMVELAGEATRGLGRVLEVAAGTGLVTPALAAGAGEVIATDYSDAMVAALEQRVRDAGVANVRCEQADLYALRFDVGAFDAVVAANVLHLVPDLPGALTVLRRVLKPGGKIIVPTFCHDETALSWVISRALAVTGFPGHRRFTAKSLREEVEAAGVRVTRTEVLPGVIEAEYGEWTGQPIKELAKTELWKQVQRAPSLARFPAGESILEMQTRAVAAIQEVAARHVGQLVVVVSHADVIKAAVAHYAGMHLDQFQRLVISRASGGRDAAWLARGLPAFRAMAGCVSWGPSLNRGRPRRRRRGWRPRPGGSGGRGRAGRRTGRNARRRAGAHGGR